MTTESVAQIYALDLMLEPAIDFGIQRSRDFSDGAASAAVNGSSVVAFSQGIPLQTQEDILYSMQIAAASANKKANRQSNIEGWYIEYIRVLELTGWVIRNWAPTRRSIDEAEVDVAEVALDLLATAITGPALVVMKAAVDAMKSMSDDDGYIRLFEHYGADGSVGNFQLGAVEEGAAGDLNLGLGAYQFTMSERKKKILFIKWRKQEVKLWGGACNAVFSRAAYDDVRQAVKDKLGPSRQDAVARLDI